MDHSTSNVIELPFSIDKEDLTNSVWKVIEILKPKWRQDSIKHKVCRLDFSQKNQRSLVRATGIIFLQIFSDGITNSLVGVIHEDDKVNMILVRVFGENTDKIIDRNAELVNMKVTYQSI